MRILVRLALIAWLLTGLLTAPAMAFGMTCHGGMGQAEITADAPMTMPMAHQSMPHAGKDMAHKAFSCAVHCLSAGAGFILSAADGADIFGEPLPHGVFQIAPLDGLSIGPPFEPPISALV
jgi:hypothetical protein